MKYRFALCIFLLPVLYCTGQRLEVTSVRRVAGDSTKSARPASHYIGVQANQLINQLLSFGNNAPAVNNPYALIYSVNSNVTGWGFNAGLGYNVHSTDDNSDPNNERTSTLNKFSLRMGFEKKSYLSKKWLASFGFDLLVEDESSNTANTTKFQFDFNKTEIKGSTSTFGFGPRFGLNYFISERLLLGTEATYYLKSIKVNQKVTNTSSSTFTDPNTGQRTTTVNTTTSESNQKNTDFVFTAPIAIFLIVKF